MPWYRPLILLHGVVLEDKVVEGVKGIVRIKINVRYLRSHVE
jgi:hypothetical protein